MGWIERLYVLLIASLPVVRPWQPRFSGMAVQVSDAIFLLVALLWLVELIRGRRPFVWSGLYALLLIYLIALGCSIWLSPDESASWAKLLGTAYLAGLSVLTVNVVRSWPVLRAVMLAWIGGLAITVLCGILAIVLFFIGLEGPAAVFGLAHYGSLPAGDYPRIQALFANMNMLCNYMIPSVMVVLVARALGWLAPLRTRVLLIGAWVTTLFTLSVGIGGLVLATVEWRRRRLGIVRE